MKKIIFIAMSLTMLLTACSPAQPSTSHPASSASVSESAAAPLGIGFEGVRAVLKPQPVQPVNKGFVKGINGFGLKSASMLYNSNANLAFSPVSLELALAMTRTGAAGQTAEEMAETLGLGGLSEGDIAAACRSLMWRANTGGMEAANSIWVDQGYPFSIDFLRGCADNFMADAFPLAAQGSMNDINAWADEKTHGKISAILDHDPGPPLVLCNALYFLGNWENPFEAINTHDGDFAAPSGNVTVSFMNDERGAAYYNNDNFSMLSLPFKSGEGEGKYAMAFLLPAEGSNLNDMLSTLDAESFSTALSGLRDQPVRIRLPKFEYSYLKSFVETLKALGMKSAFGPADFSKMTDGPNDLYINEVLHKCYIKVDELGAEAAAVTVVEMRGGDAMPPENIAEFHADRPFVFVIYSQEDGTIAFLGAVNDPTKK